MSFFHTVTEDNFENVVNGLFENESAAAVLEFFSKTPLSGELEFAIANSYDTLLVRVFDGEEYVFAFPEPLSENADIKSALSELEKYVIKEELPFVLLSVPKGALSYLSAYRHVRLDSDFDGEEFVARIETECGILKEKPSHIGGRVSLNALTEADIPTYAQLCRNEELLLYWGYDYRPDFGERDDRFFFDMTEAEFESGVAMTLAVRRGERLVGSIEFYAFDFHGAAELDVRIFPHEQGKGYASSAVEGAIEIARQMGILRLSALVMNNNAPSLALFAKYAKNKNRDKKTTTFSLDI